MPVPVALHPARLHTTARLLGQRLTLRHDQPRPLGNGLPVEAGLANDCADAVARNLL